MVGRKLNGHKNLTKNVELTKYLKPNKVYIPLINGNDSDVTLLVSKGDYVYKDMMIAKTKGNFRISINASVSGTVLGVEEKYYLNGNQVKCLVVENDFKENVKNIDLLTSDIHNYTKEEFVNLLKDCGIVGMGGSGFPTYVKYDTDVQIKTLIINAVECEPYITADYKLIFEHIENVLEAIDAIMKINNIDEAIIGIKKTNKELINKINNYIGTYDKIKLKLVPNIYPMGWERTLIKNVKNVDYKNLPIEENIVVNNISTIYAIYEALKYHKCLTERIVTFSGEMLSNPQNILLKVGTNLEDVFNDILKVKKDRYIMVAGGPMMGKIIDGKDLVVSSNMNCVLILNEVKDLIPEECLRCGKCSQVCPALLTPVLIKDYVDDLEMIKELEVNRCVECGLCSYVCPAKIDVREFVKKAKQNLRKEK